MAKTPKIINLHSNPSEYASIKQDVKDIYEKFGIKVHSIDIKPVENSYEFDVSATLFPDLDNYDLDEDSISFNDSDSQINIAFTVKPGAIEHPKREQTQLIALVALLNDLLSLDSDEMLTDQEILKANYTFLDKVSNDLNKNINDPLMLQYSLKVLRASLPHLIKSNYGFNIEKAYKTNDIHSILQHKQLEIDLDPKNIRAALIRSNAL